MCLYTHSYREILKLTLPPVWYSQACMITMPYNDNATDHKVECHNLNVSGFNISMLIVFIKHT